jgi:pimeloyl-ACP methyl ester carboxylesterase
MRFVLVHGGWHGAWCWSRTIPELQRLGHQAVAIDLPGSGELIGEDNTFDNHRDALLAVMRPGDVLVGHSGGGFAITIAANAAPEMVGHLVYLAASLPPEGGTFASALVRNGSAEPEQIIDDVMDMTKYVETGPDGKQRLTFEGAWQLFYHDCDEATARWAFERFTYGHSHDIVRTPVSVPRFWEADLPRSFIRCTQDRAQPTWYADVVSDRLGVAPLRINSSHSPFASRPAELAELLVHATSTVPVGPLKPT